MESWCSSLSTGITGIDYFPGLLSSLFLRFHSWVSYYESEHGGRVFTVFEYSIDVLLLVYFAIRAFQYLYSQKRLSRYIEVQQYVIDNPIV